MLVYMLQPLFVPLRREKGLHFCQKSSGSATVHRARMCLINKPLQQKKLRLAGVIQLLPEPGIYLAGAYLGALGVE